jgi:hypothetical protein
MRLTLARTFIAVTSYALMLYNGTIPAEITGIEEYITL